jgi:hypothetical protein
MKKMNISMMRNLLKKMLSQFRIIQMQKVMKARKRNKT